MARTHCRIEASRCLYLEPERVNCWFCGKMMWIAYHTKRTITTLGGSCQLMVSVRRCRNATCPQYHLPYRPEAEGHWALPHGEFGLDIIALVGTLRNARHQSIPEIHHVLQERGVSIAEHTITHLLYRYEELVALHVSDQKRLHSRLKEQAQVILALDGLQPDVGHEVLWAFRDWPASVFDEKRHVSADREKDENEIEWTAPGSRGRSYQ